MTPTASAQPTVPLRGALTAGLTGGLVAAVVNAVIFFAAQGLNGGPLVVEAGASPQPLSLVAVLLFSVLPGLVAGLIYWILARFTRRPARCGRSSSCTSGPPRRSCGRSSGGAVRRARGEPLHRYQQVLLDPVRHAALFGFRDLLARGRQHVRV